MVLLVILIRPLILSQVSSSNIIIDNDQISVVDYCI